MPKIILSSLPGKAKNTLWQDRHCLSTGQVVPGGINAETRHKNNRPGSWLKGHDDRAGVPVALPKDEPTIARPETKNTIFLNS